MSKSLLILQIILFSLIPYTFTKETESIQSSNPISDSIFLESTSSTKNNVTEKIMCTKSSDCLGNHICKNNKCIHRGFFPPNLSQIIEIILMCGLSSVATVAGVGGGAIYSALFMFIENFDAKVAFPITSFSICVCALVTFTLGVKNKMRNPKDRFVDYDLAIVFCPALILGTKIGVIFNTIFPTLLLIIFLIASLSFSCYKTYRNAVKATKREREMIAASVIENKNLGIDDKSANLIEKNKHVEMVQMDVPKNGNSMITPQMNNINQSISSYYGQNKNFQIDSSGSNQEKPLDLFYDKESPIRMVRVKWIILIEIIMFIDQLLEGTNKLSSIINIRRCSEYFWEIFILFAAFCICFSKIFYARVKDESEPREINNNEFDIASPEVEGKIGKIISFCFLAGMVSGMLGIGGGIFMAPLMLELGIETKTATSTSNFFLIFTSFSSTCLYTMAGNLKVEYALLFGTLCGLSSYFGSSYLNNYVKRTKKNSVLIWTLLFVSVVSLFILPINAIRLTVFNYKIGKGIFRFNSYC